MQMRDLLGMFFTDNQFIDRYPATDFRLLYFGIDALPKFHMAFAEAVLRWLHSRSQSEE